MYKNLKIILDFDETLTHKYKLKKNQNNSINVFRLENYTNKNYVKKANELFNFYHPKELDEKILKKDKKKLMDEWWMRHFFLLKKYGVGELEFLDIIKKDKIKLRNGVVEFFEFFYKKKVPIIIFSSGTGNLIKMVLEKNKILFSNVKIISNFWKFDKNGKFIELKNKKILTSQNKFGNFFPEKNNVILIGNNLLDLSMCKKYKKIFTICFYSKLDNLNLNLYKKSFDLIIDDEKTFKEINIKNILWKLK